jgi:uncharacterized membrane protein
MMILTTIAIPLGIVIFGALVHATAQLKVARDKAETFTWADFTILFVIAAFSGTIFGMTSTLFFESQTIITLSAGIGAFLGMAGVNAIANAFLSMLVSKIEGTKHDK